MKRTEHKLNFDLDVAAMLGYRVYNVDGGKMVPTAKFAVADTMGGEEDFYVEAETIDEVLDELDDMLESALAPATANHAEET